MLWSGCEPARRPRFSSSSSHCSSRSRSDRAAGPPSSGGLAAKRGSTHQAVTAQPTAISRTVETCMNQRLALTSTAYVFKDKEIELKRGNYIEVLGKVQEHEGQAEIIGDRIRLVD